MDPLLVTIGIVGILLGLVGVLVPVLPGSLVVWAATAGTLLVHRPDTLAWVVAVVLGVLGIAGSLATVVLPARTGMAGGAPRSSVALAMVGAMVGFFVLPVLGFLVGGVAGLVVGEWQRAGDWRPAWRSALRILRAYGLGVLVDLGLSLCMVAIWVAAVILRG